MKPGSQGEHQLQKKYRTTDRADGFYRNQMRQKLNGRMIELIQRQEMVFIATADAQGQCDCSPRCGIAGFVRVLDTQTLLYPEYRGNGVMASLGNISENPHIGMVFVDFFQTTVGLHVNGNAQIIENEQLENLQIDPAILQNNLCSNGKKPERWVKVLVEEAYIHCAKHIPLLQKKEKSIAWGTDDPIAKGGDFYNLQPETEPLTLASPDHTLEG